MVWNCAISGRQCH